MKMTLKTTAAISSAFVMAGAAGCAPSVKGMEDTPHAIGLVLMIPTTPQPGPTGKAPSDSATNNNAQANAKESGEQNKTASAGTPAPATSFGSTTQPKRVIIGYTVQSQDPNAPKVIGIGKRPVAEDRVTDMEVEVVRGASDTEVVTSGIQKVLSPVQVGVNFNTVRLHGYEGDNYNVEANGTGGAGGAGATATASNGPVNVTQAQQQGQQQAQEQKTFVDQKTGVTYNVPEKPTKPTKPTKPCVKTHD